MACRVQERHPAAGVALGHRHNEAKVGLQQVVFGAFAVADDPAQVPAQLRGELFGVVLYPVHPLGGVKAGLDLRGEPYLVLGVEQRDLADLLEIRPHGVGGQGELALFASPA